MTRRLAPVVLGLNREEAADAVGVSANVFDRMVAAGELPRPHVSGVSARLIWRVAELDKAIAELPTKGVNASKLEDIEI